MLARRDVFPKYWRCCQHLNGTSEQPGCSFGSLALVRLRAHARLALAGPALAGAAGHAEGACGPAPAVYEDLVDARLVGQALFDDELGLADGGCVDAVADVAPGVRVVAHDHRVLAAEACALDRKSTRLNSSH